MNPLIKRVIGVNAVLGITVDEALNRRNFLRLFGLGTAGVAATPAVLANMPAAAAPAAVAAAAPANWTVGMQYMLSRIHDHFVHERAAGFINPETGAEIAGVGEAAAQQRWMAVAPRWTQMISTFSPEKIASVMGNNPALQQPCELDATGKHPEAVERPRHEPMQAEEPQEPAGEPPAAPQAAPPQAQVAQQAAPRRPAARRGVNIYRPRERDRDRRDNGYGPNPGPDQPRFGESKAKRIVADMLEGKVIKV